MRKLFVLLLMFCLLSGCNRATPSIEHLITMSSRDSGHEYVDITLREIERTANTSIVNLKIDKGTSTATIIYLSCSFKILCKLRGFKYFSLLKHWDDTDESGSLIAFSNTPFKNVQEHFSEILKRKHGENEKLNEDLETWTSIKDPSVKFFFKAYNFKRYEKKTEKKIFAKTKNITSVSQGFLPLRSRNPKGITTYTYANDEINHVRDPNTTTSSTTFHLPQWNQTLPF